MRNRFVPLIMVLILAVSVLTGVFVYQYMQEETATFEEDLTLTLDGEEQKTLSVNGLNLIPGESKDCEVTLVASSVGDYVIAVSFKKQSEGTLDQYVNVELSVNGTTQVRPLNEVFATNGGHLITFTVEASTSEVLTIRYVMPETVGDEAQGATCSFDVTLTVTLAQ